MDEEYVLVKASEYKRLINDSDRVTCLDAFGVDNWVGYGDAVCEEDGDGLSYVDMVKENFITVKEMPKYNSKGEPLENN